MVENSYRWDEGHTIANDYFPTEDGDMKIQREKKTKVSEISGETVAKC